MNRLAVLALMLFSPSAWAAPTLSLPPSAARTAEDSRAMGSYPLPIGPWENGQIATITTEGEVTQTAWRIHDGDITTMGLLAALRDQLQGEGFEVLFECDTDACGGFDFRFGTPVLSEPEMHVDLGDFRFLSARRVDGPEPDYLSLLVSRSSESGFVQMTRIGAALETQATLAEAAPTPVSASAGFGGQFDASGKVILTDLSFPSGAARLAKGDYVSLQKLSEWLKSNPGHRVALVGHTDAEGALDANIALSRKRAQSVRDRLVSGYGVNPGQLSADGVGYLSPLASNLTPEGRTQNRRVEAMITSTH